MKPAHGYGVVCAEERRPRQSPTLRDVAAEDVHLVWSRRVGPEVGEEARVVKVEDELQPPPDVVGCFGRGHEAAHRRLPFEVVLLDEI
jgi:hypothetical protein